jgi:hypothetical protein
MPFDRSFFRLRMVALDCDLSLDIAPAIIAKGGRLWRFFG